MVAHSVHRNHGNAPDRGCGGGSERDRSRGGHRRLMAEPIVSCCKRQERYNHPSPARPKEPIDLKTQSEYGRKISDMSGKTQIPVRRWPDRAIALAILIGIVLAPVCAPLCATKSCHSSRTDSAVVELCHRAAAANTDAPEFSLESTKTCGLADLLAALRTKDRQDAREMHDALSRQVETRIQGLALPQEFRSTSWWSAGLTGLSGSAFPETTILRI